MPWLGMGQTNRQAWALALTRRYPNAEVLYLETLGWAPRLNFPGAVAEEDRIQRTSGWNLVPWGGRPINSLARRVNGFLTRLMLRMAGWSEPDLVVVFDPLSLNVVKHLDFKALVYDCLDLYAAQPQFARYRSSARIIERGERELAGIAQVVSASSPALVHRFKDFGIDAAFFAGAPTLLPGSIERFTRTGSVMRAVYVGALDPYKIDLSAFETLLGMDTDVEITIVGRLEFAAKGSGSTQLRRVLDHPKVRVLGPVHRQGLRAVLETHDFGIVTMTPGAYSDHSFPMKTWDYLASGLPVLAVGARSLEAVQFGVVGVNSSEGISTEVLESLRDMRRDPDALARYAMDHDAESRVSGIVSLLNARRASSGLEKIL